LKLLQKSIGKALEDKDKSKDFLDRTPVTQEIRARID
jgi:hypothetical protein